MSGLIRKDFLIMRGGLSVYFLLCVGCYVLLAWLGSLNFGFILSSNQLLLMLLPLSTFYQDEQTGWDRCAMCLPLGHKAVVGARYLFVLGLALLAAVTGLIGSVVVRLLGWQDFTKLAITFLFAFAVSLVMTAVLLPLIYMWGTQKARVSLCILIVLFAVSLMLMAWFDFLDPSALNRMDEASLAALTGKLALLPLAGLAALFLSYRISCRIVARKEY